MHFETCPGSGQTPAALTRSYVEVSGGIVVSKLNEYAAEELGQHETREFGTCPACRGQFVMDTDWIRHHHRLVSQGGPRRAAA